jgi:CheY-like chemotaxis protein
MKYKVLLCEDNPADVNLVEAALRASGLSYKLQIAHNGEEARALIQSLGTAISCPDVILMDLNLPPVDGRELIRVLRENRACAETPIVVLASSVWPGDEQGLRRLGVNRCIRKPTNLRDFLEIGEHVRELLEASKRNRWES